MFLVCFGFATKAKHFLSDLKTHPLFSSPTDMTSAFMHLFSFIIHHSLKIQHFDSLISLVCRFWFPSDFVMSIKNPISSTMTSTTPATNSSSPSHLIILVHGFIGSPQSMNTLANALRQSAAGDELLVHIAQSNYGKVHSFFTTTDGIEVGGNRLAAEVTEVAQKHSKTLRRISFVGVSLGGLYCRWAAHVLSDLNTRTIAGLQPHLYISLASPHLGVAHSLHPGNKGLMWALSKCGERSGAQLLGYDKFELMNLLATPPFLAAWALFDRRILFANLVNDNRVDYTSAALLLAPFDELHDRAVLADTNREIVAVYDIADHRESPSNNAPPYATGAQLAPEQTAILKALRAAPMHFINVDVHLDKNFLSRLFAHSSLHGMWVQYGYGLQGQESMERIVGFLLESHVNEKKAVDLTNTDLTTASATSVDANTEQDFEVELQEQN